MTKPNDPPTNAGVAAASGDPFLDEVHRLKRDAFARSGNDLATHFERLKRMEQEWKGRVLADETKDSTGTDAA